MCAVHASQIFIQGFALHVAPIVGYRVCVMFWAKLFSKLTVASGTLLTISCVAGLMTLKNSVLHMQGQSGMQAGRQNPHLKNLSTTQGMIRSWVKSSSVARKRANRQTDLIAFSGSIGSAQRLDEVGELRAAQTGHRGAGGMGPDNMLEIQDRG